MFLISFAGRVHYGAQLPLVVNYDTLYILTSLCGVQKTGLSVDSILALQSRRFKSIQYRDKTHVVLNKHLAKRIKPDIVCAATLKALLSLIGG